MQPIYNNTGLLVGYIVRTDAGSYFVQTKRVIAGHCVNMGLRYK